jgi:hypothetical protein
MMRFFEQVELTPEDEEALTEAAESTPLDDPELEAAVQAARRRLSSETGSEQRTTTPPPLPASGQ